MEYKPLPECIDRLARIETVLENFEKNHIKHIEKEIQDIRADGKTTQRFIIAQVIGVGIAMLGLLARALL